MNLLKLLVTLSGAALLPVSCNVKDTIYETSHPRHGKITLTADWSDRGAGIDIPAGYTVTLGSYTGTFTQSAIAPDELFDPGAYGLYVYNTPGNPSVSGTTATADYAAGTLGWLFTSAQRVTIEPDRVQEFTAVMRQQVRQLTLVIAPTGSTADKISGITGTLSGAAGSYDLENAAHGTPSNVALTFTQQTTGDFAGKWTATVRLLGVAGTEQKLTGSITFTDALPGIALASDLTAKLSGFNAGKKEPVTLDGKAELHSFPGFTATITEWNNVPPGTGIAN